MAKVEPDDSNDKLVVVEQQISKSLSEQIDKLVNLCKQITISSDEAKEEYQITVSLAKQEEMDDLSINLLIRKRLLQVIGRDRLRRLAESMGMKYTLDKKPSRKKTADDDDDDDDTEEETYPVRTVIELPIGITKEIFQEYLAHKTEDDFRIKLTIEANCNVEEARLFGGQVIGVKK